MFWQTTTAEAGWGGPPDPGWGLAPGKLLSCEQELLGVRADLAAAAQAWVSPAGKAFRDRLYEHRYRMSEAAELLRDAARAINTADVAAQTAMRYGRLP
ncbi:hypothetical protein [Arthrobacter sulfonylureivorans]|uniref:Uncharacterized protein n=1 Tax=Arthrobacter sulfonylureivorans TaxID=2486855 RepID=A0ABY3W9L5_9MICC|nr:hypothetical protein [Arthrobacter sulfonylureivorans]UNK46147.1 hypothetical protein MNQ99_01890 [Arthrobacter sulfonylureivorans]